MNIKTTIKTGAVLALVFTAAISACSKKEIIVEPQALNTIKVSDLAADTILGLTPIGQPYSANRFTFYSLETNSIIPASDSATDKWDLAFRGSLIVTNSGNMGPSQGGAFVWNGIYENLKEIPADSAFRTENAPAAYAVPFGSGKGWYVYNQPLNLLTPVPGKVIVVKTAKGRYAKVEILNYYKGGVTPAAAAPDAEKLSKQRYYTFRFTLQPNGSKKF